MSEMVKGKRARRQEGKAEGRKEGRKGGRKIRRKGGKAEGAKLRKFCDFQAP
jgi:hypothetical protein